MLSSWPKVFSLLTQMNPILINGVFPGEGSLLAMRWPRGSGELSLVPAFSL